MTIMQPIPLCPLTPAQLDRQCSLTVHEWLDIDSPQAKEMDEYYFVTKKWLHIGVEAGVMFIDLHGRLWGNGHDSYYPYHFESRGKLYGYRIAAKAAN